MFSRRSGKNICGENCGKILEFETVKFYLRGTNNYLIHGQMRFKITLNIQLIKINSLLNHS